MTETEVISIMREYLEGLFPKVCRNCHRRYATLRDFLLKTGHVGPAIPYDVELGNWKPLKPIGPNWQSSGSTSMRRPISGPSCASLWIEQARPTAGSRGCPDFPLNFPEIRLIPGTPYGLMGRRLDAGGVSQRRAVRLVLRCKPKCSSSS